MKKLMFSIPKPCHEDWSAMTPEARGRFCGSCQKTVVDFTTMSDAKLAQFFKEPAERVCGRFHPDQLDRPMEIPKKRIPWVKYFFTMTWPALVLLLLKGCGNVHQKTTGDILQKMHAPPPAPGNVIVSEVAVIDESNCTVSIVDNKASLIGDTILRKEVNNQTIVRELVSPETFYGGKVSEDTLAEPITVRNDSMMLTQLQGVLGGLMVTQLESAVPENETPKDDIVQPKSKLLVYSNPVQPGGDINIQTTLSGNLTIELFSTSGQRVIIKRMTVTHPLRFTMPSFLVRGNYVLQISNGKLSHSQTIVVL